jgi:hypothetical protein
MVPVDDGHYFMDFFCSLKCNKFQQKMIQDKFFEIFSPNITFVRSIDSYVEEFGFVPKFLESENYFQCLPEDNILTFCIQGVVQDKAYYCIEQFSDVLSGIKEKYLAPGTLEDIGDYPQCVLFGEKYAEIERLLRVKRLALKEFAKSEFPYHWKDQVAQVHRSSPNWTR